MVTKVVAGGIAARSASEGFSGMALALRFGLVCQRWFAKFCLVTTSPRLVRRSVEEDFAMNNMRRFLAWSILAAWFCSSLPAYASRPPTLRDRFPDGQSDGLDLAALIGKRLSVSTSRTVFTLFALLNVAGYDEEDNPQGMHAVRKRVRDRLARATPEQLRHRLQAYYRQHGKVATTDSYAAVALATSGPPGF